MNILFYDSEYTGHHIEFVSHLVEYIINNKPQDFHFYFALPSFFEKKISIVDSEPQISFVYLEEEELNVKQGRWDLLTRSKQEVQNIIKYGEAFEVDEVFCLNINPLLLNLAIREIDSPFQISGIYFHPFIRLDYLRNGHFFNRIRYFQKKFFIRRLIERKYVRGVYVLNDLKGVENLNEILKTNKFRWLPDPINITNIQPVEKVNNDRKVFLFFGFINKRKGVITFLQSLKLLDKELLKTIEIRISGQIDEDIEDELGELLTELNELKSVKIVLRKEFLTNEELVREIGNCDFIAMPYLRVEGSSGLLGWAAAAQKPVLGPSKGLIGELIRNYKLGLSVNCDEIKELSVGISKGLERNFEIDTKLQEKYCAERQPNKFAQIIINDLIE